MEQLSVVLLSSSTLQHPYRLSQFVQDIHNVKSFPGGIKRSERATPTTHVLHAVVLLHGDNFIVCTFSFSKELYC
jgi:hypothetical protein